MYFLLEAQTQKSFFQQFSVCAKAAGASSQQGTEVYRKLLLIKRNRENSEVFLWWFLRYGLNILNAPENKHRGWFFVDMVFIFQNREKVFFVWCGFGFLIFIYLFLKLFLLFLFLISPPHCPIQVTEVTWKHVCGEWNVLVGGRSPGFQPIISEKVHFFPFFCFLQSILPVFLGVNFFCKQSRMFNFDEIHYSSCKNVLCSHCTSWFKRQLCFIWFILFITIDFDVRKSRILDSWAAIGYWIDPDQLVMLFLLIQESCWAHYKCSCRKNFLPSALCEVR